MVLAAIHVPIPQRALGAGPLDRDLDRIRHVDLEEGRDLALVEAIGLSHRTRADGAGLANGLVTGAVAKENVEGEAIGAGILAADDVGEVLERARLHVR